MITEQSILIMTLVFLLGTYWILIWRINKLTNTIKKLTLMSDNISSIKDYVAQGSQYLKKIGDGNIILSGKIPAMGQVDLQLNFKK